MNQKQLKKQHSQINENLPEKFVNRKPLPEINHEKSGYLFHQSVVLLLLLMMFSMGVSAQVKWGVRAGINASTQSEIGNIYDNNHLRAGMNGGLVAKAQVNDWLGMNSGLGYQLKGKKVNIPEEDTKRDTQLSYLVLPVKAELSAGRKAGLKNGQRLFFATGPYAGYLLNARQISQRISTGVKDDFNAVDFGWTSEMGIEFPVTANRAFQVSLNYDMGIREIAKDAGAQNKTASLNLGFLF